MELSWIALRYIFPVFVNPSIAMKMPRSLRRWEDLDEDLWNVDKYPMIATSPRSSSISSLILVSSDLWEDAKISERC